MSRSGPLSTFTGGISADKSTSRTKEHQEKQNPWLNAWSDPLAGIQSHTPCFLTCDLYGDGEERLVIANRSRPPKLREYKGTKLATEVVLPDVPIAIAAFYPERPESELVELSTKKISPNAPSLAVAIGEHLFVYRALQPELKFRVPPGSLPRNERPLWMKLKHDLANISKEFIGVDVYEAVHHAAQMTNLANGHHSPLSTVRRVTSSDSSPSRDPAVLESAAEKVVFLIRSFVLRLKHMRDNIASPAPLSPLAKDLLALGPSAGSSKQQPRLEPIAPTLSSTSPNSNPQPTVSIVSAANQSLQLHSSSDTLERLAPDGLPLISGSQILYTYRTIEAPLEVPACATCLSTVARSPTSSTGASSEARSHIIIGSENSKVYVLNSQATEVMFSFEVPSPPVSIHVVGHIDVDYQFYICCRDNNIYCAKKDRPLTLVVSADGSLVEAALGDRMVYVATADNIIRAYTTHGKLDFKIPMMEPIVGLSVLRLPRQPGAEALLVALRSGVVKLMNGRECISEVKTPAEEQEEQQRKLLGITAQESNAETSSHEDPVTAMRFQSYGREEGALLLAYRSGALVLKILQRRFTIPVSMSLNTVPPPEQNIPLDIPSLTKLYIQQSDRLREQSIGIHQSFEKDLCQLRLMTAKTYLNVLTGVEGPVTSSLAASLRVSAEVMGLGPVFRLRIEVSNLSSKPLHGLCLTIVHDSAVTKISNPSIQLPALFPGSDYTFSFTLTTIASPGNAVKSSNGETTLSKSDNEQAQSSLLGTMSIGMATSVTVQITSVASSIPLICSNIPIPAPQSVILPD